MGTKKDRYHPDSPYDICLQRRRRDLNPRAAINDLHPFQGCPFGLLGTSPSKLIQSTCIYLYGIPKIIQSDFRSETIANGEGGIRTHAPLRTNGFQDRLVMTTSIPLLKRAFQ